MDTEDIRELPEDARTALGNYIQAAPEPDAPEPDALQRALLTPRYPDAPEGSPRARLDALRAQAAEHFRADMEIWEFAIIAELRCLHLANEIAEQSLRTYFWIAVGQAAVIVAGVVTVAVLLG